MHIHEEIAFSKLVASQRFATTTNLKKGRLQNSVSDLEGGGGGLPNHFVQTPVFTTLSK